MALGEILVAEKRYTEARGTLEQAVLLDGSSVKAHYQLGLVLTRLGICRRSQKRVCGSEDPEYAGG